MLIFASKFTSVCFALVMTALAIAGAGPETGDQGKTLYRQYCIRCHGAVLHLFAKLDEHLFVQSVSDGKGLMPAFGSKLTAQDVKILWSYIKTKDD